MQATTLRYLSVRLHLSCSCQKHVVHYQPQLDKPILQQQQQSPYLLPLAPTQQPSARPRHQPGRGYKSPTSTEQGPSWTCDSSSKKFSTSLTKGCTSTAPRVAGGCLRKHGCLQKHRPNFSLRKQLCLHQNISKIFPPARAQAVGCWRRNTDLGWIPGVFSSCSSPPQEGTDWGHPGRDPLQPVTPQAAGRIVQSKVGKGRLLQPPPPSSGEAL